jgi:hypothetical protein
VALILTFMIWMVVSALIILLPMKALKNPESPGYQSIALQLGPLEGIPQNSLVETSVSQFPSQVLEESPVPDNISVPPVAEPILSPASEPASVSEAISSSVSESVVKPVKSATVSPPVEKNLQNSSTTDPEQRAQPVDVDAIDAAEWEALFAEKGSRTYNTNSSTEKPQTSSPAPSSRLSGVAGTVNQSSTAGETQVLSEEQANTQAPSGTLSQETVAALERLATTAGASGTPSPANNLRASSPVGIEGTSSPTAVAGTDMNLVGGGSRRLLEPKEPVIVISAKNQSLITGSTDVTITFEITPEGLVLPSTIKITPESLVPGPVQVEIKSQIEKWRFQVAQGSGQVRFKYNIIKK